MTKAQIKKAFKEYVKPDLSSIEKIRALGYRVESVPYVVTDLNELSAEEIESEILDLSSAKEAGWIVVKLNSKYEGYNYAFVDEYDINSDIISFIEKTLNAEDDKINSYVFEDCADIIGEMFI